ncbi:MAG TPA: LacI family DNA-binding transcriptional regulator [Longimicrobiaceae bacterium]|nr:LacI family DNA-binding transcriptional regulator [Longimicrobiaceae bacterium]
MATIKDVAREVGVSVATVSRVFNGNAPVRPETRERVLDAAHRLRYVPNAAARSLITNRAHTLGVLLPDLFGEFFSEVLRGIDHMAQQNGYHLLVSNCHDEHRGLEAAIQAMQGRVDGIIVMAPDLDAGRVEETIPDGTAAVLLNCRRGARVHQSLTVDNRGGARAATRHLIEHGYRRVSIIRGAAGNRDAEDRLIGYREAMREFGGAWAEDLEVLGDFSESSGYRAARALLALPERPRAIFASNDGMAIGALSALGEAGVRVPEEIAIVGFDDIPVSRYVNPPLTTMEVLINDLGGRACQLLLDAVEGRDGVGLGGRAEIVPTRLVVRSSCGCAAAQRSP